MAKAKKPGKLTEINRERQAIIKQYLSPEDITPEVESLSICELQEHPDGEDSLFLYAFTELFDRSKPTAKVINLLKHSKGLSTSAANFIVNKITREVGGSINYATESAQFLNFVNNHIASLSEIIEDIQKDGMSDIDIGSLDEQLRRWVDMKMKFLQMAASTEVSLKGIAVEDKKADALSTASMEDLERLLRKLDDVE